MYLTADKTSHALSIAATVLEHPKLFNGDERLIPISIDELMDVVSEMSSHKIDGREVVFEASFLRGRIERFNDRTATIDVRSSQDRHLKRLVAAKEAMHLLVDQDDDMSPYGDQTLQTLVDEGHIGVLTSDNDLASDSQSELIAEIAAREVLWPISLRLRDLNDDDDPTTFVSRMSARYGLPFAVVSSMISGSYAKFVLAAFRGSSN